jgi:5-methylcytosine-specific restriction endonuclease McrA
MRTCRKCGEQYPLTKEFFGHQPNGSYRYTCRKCVRENVRRHYWDDPYRSIERTEMRRSAMFTQSERRSIGSQLIERDGGFFCFYCKAPLDGSYHIDHKTPYARGGAHHLDNFALACLQCNQEKHSKTLEEYRAWLRDRGEAVLF